MMKELFWLLILKENADKNADPAVEGRHFYTVHVRYFPLIEDFYPKNVDVGEKR